MLPLLLRIDQDVARLDVAVHETAGVCSVERRGNLRNQGDRARRLEAAVASEQRTKVAPLDEAHRDVDVPIRLAGRIHRDHVRMVDARRQPRLAQDALTRGLVVHEPGRQHLQRDGTGEMGVDRTEHLTHPTAPKEALEGVAGDLVALGEVRFGRHGDCAIPCERDNAPLRLATQASDHACSWRWRTAGGSLAIPQVLPETASSPSARWRRRASRSPVDSRSPTRRR